MGACLSIAYPVFRRPAMRWLEPLFPIDGMWHGAYQYTYTSNDEYYPSTVSFMINLRLGMLGRFTGSVQDDPSHGFPEDGRVAGGLWGNRITFIKKMPVFYVAYQSKLCSLERFIKEQYQDELCNQLAHPDIFYEGYWQRSIGEFRGDWHILPEQIILKSGRRFELPRGTGTWHMVRVNER